MKSIDSSPRNGRLASTSVAACVALLFAGCSGGSNPSAGTGTGGDFFALSTTPATNGQLFLNESISVDFSNPVNLSTANLNTVAFQVFDLNNNPVNEQPQGTFLVEDSPGDAPGSGRRLVFAPRFPTNDTFDNGGFRPGRRYLVQLVSGTASTSLTDMNNRRLDAPASFQFDTADGSTPFELFKDTVAGGPRRTGFSVTQDTGGFAPLSLLGTPAVEVRLDFDQPLNPSTVNVPTTIDPDPTKRAGQNKGRIYLEYDDGATAGIWIPATVELERNTLQGSTVVLRPIGVLPNNATIRVVVEATTEDLSGESNISNTAYNKFVNSFNTSQSFEPQYDAIVEQFADASNTIDFTAPILEPLAEVKSGKLRSTFRFDGQPSTLDYVPSSAETLLNTNFTQVVPLGAEPINVQGGVFRFANVNIPAGRLVRGLGPNPMVWLVTGNFEINGTLSVNGGDGARVDVLNSANFPTAGGIGACGGGNGGKGSPNPSDRSFSGEAGFGPGQKPGRGGNPGELNCTGGGTGSAGGGGSYSTQGDPEFLGFQTTNPASWDQWTGFGGNGSGTLQGGAPGARPFVDSRNDNNFFGQGVNIAEGIRIQGELLAAQGGAGGGGGGDKSANCAAGSSTFINDQKGGGGGAGGGVLIIQALGKISIGAQGRIIANGGNGGGGEQAGSNNAGGGGGAGSGGMIILMAAGGVEIERHGPAPGTYASGNTNFAIAADGGISKQGDFLNEEIESKYGSGWNASFNVGQATGGFGGMGIVQILTPPGDDLDGTGNRLDDNITFLNQGGVLPADDKKALLSWRGWPNSSGDRVDDNGDPIPTTLRDGDIRPSPILLPLTFGDKQAARSRWIDLGSVRRELGTTGPNRVNAAQLPQPDFEFGGVVESMPGAGDFADDGYVSWDSSTNAQDIPVVLGDRTFSDLVTSSTFRGQPAYRIRADLGTAVDNRYSHYRVAVLNSAGSEIGDFRIMGHERVVGASDSFIYLAPEAIFPTDGVNIRVLAKFFAVTTDEQQGLGAFIAGGGPTGGPRANVRVRFAFHVDPNSTDPTLRYPQTGFSGNVPMLLSQMAADGNRPGFVQYDVLFDQRFRDNNPITANMPRQTVDYLVLPFRF